MATAGGVIKLPVADGTEPVVSVVVMLTHDARQAERCLAGVAAFAAGAGPAETVIVLNNSSADVRSLVGERTSGARIIDSDANTGTAIGWNLGFAAARARRVLLLHEDAAPCEGMVETLVAALDADPNAALVSPWLRKEAGAAPNNGGWLFWQDLSSAALDPSELPERFHDTPYAVDYVSSAVSLWDKAAWQEIGGFDERRFPAIGLEPDCCAALWARGRSVMVVPAACGIHRSGAMDSAPGPLSGEQLRWFLFEESQPLWLEKWSRMLDWYLDNSRFGWTARVPVERLIEALDHAERRRTERPLLPQPAVAKHPITDPAETGSWPDALDDAARERLRAAQRAVIDAYCMWLIEDGRRLREEIKSVVRDHDAISQARADLELRSETLERIVNTRWWKLRGWLGRRLGAVAAAALGRKRGEQG